MKNRPMTNREVKNEFSRWINRNRPNVWYKSPNNSNWRKTYQPGWIKDYIYIVDDKDAELRKAYCDDKAIQYHYYHQEWKDVNTYNFLLISNYSDYRIKPKLIYEWQWIIQNPKGKYWMTDYFKNEIEVGKYYPDSKVIEKFVPSQKINNEN